MAVDCNVYETLKARGFLAQMTHPELIEDQLKNQSVTFYTGFDPTADSLHLGHFLTIMAMMHLQRAGHKPIALVGGGTGRIGDPSGRTDMRKMMTDETIQHNVNCIGEQLKRFLCLDGQKGFLEDNAHWFLEKKYIEFLREVGASFSVNRMLTAECYKKRLEVGLTFLEFNYMLLQAYDFYVLHQKYGCTLEMGGDDQWSNMLAGIDLVRRKTGQETSGLTLTLLVNSEGNKMGKTAKGALWLDGEKCPPFEFFQYLRNTADADVCNYLKLLTFVPLEDIEAYEKLEGSAINEAKKRLAYEVTALVHGEEIARACAQQAADLFEGKGRSENMETLTLSSANLGQPILDALVQASFLPSKGEGRRLIQQGGLKLNDIPVSDVMRCWSQEDFAQGELILKKGKKHHLRIVLNN